MIVDVHMLAFYENKGTIRHVEIPDYKDERDKQDILDLVFQYGQNDFQPQNIYSVSVGDVIELDDEYWMVAPLGFKEITKEKFDSLEGNASQNLELRKELFTS